MNHITDFEKETISKMYLGVIKGLNKKYRETYKAIDALNELYKKIINIPAGGTKHTYRLGNNGEVSHYAITTGFENDENYFGALCFDPEHTSLWLGSTVIYFTNYQRNNRLAWENREFEKMMDGKSFNSDDIISSYKYYKTLSENLDKAVKMFDTVAEKMVRFINILEEVQHENEMKLIEFFGCEANTNRKMKRIKITVEEVEE